MRIISGKNRGRIINPPKGFKARPTTDMAKEALFNILENRYDFEELTVLDLFAGTGSISYEFASRGSREIISIESDFISAKFINETAAKLNFPIRCIRSNVFPFLKNCSKKFDVIFADPPYDMPGSEKAITMVFEKEILNPGGVMIFEHSKRFDFKDYPNYRETRNYGKVHFSFFSCEK